MGIVLFALLGAKICAGTGYWICFAIYCCVFGIEIIAKIIQKMD